MQPKTGHLFCKAYLDFVRARACFFCGKPGPSDAHHYPPKGRGITADDFTVPACRECHQRCDGQKVNGKEPIQSELQAAGVLATRSDFLRRSTDEQMKSYLSSRAAWREKAMIQL